MSAQELVELARAKHETEVARLVREFVGGSVKMLVVGHDGEMPQYGVVSLRQIEQHLASRGYPYTCEVAPDGALRLSPKVSSFTVVV